MITYVNTVLVGTGVGTVVAPNSSDSHKPAEDMTAGQYIVMDNNGNILNATTAAKAEKIRVGLVTGKNTINTKTGDKMPVIKWSNVINKADIKSYTKTAYKAETEDTVQFDFAKAITAAAASDNGVRLVVRLTFKDLPTRYRKWTESYEMLVAKNATINDVVDSFVKIINVDNRNRARVVAKGMKETTSGDSITYVEATIDPDTKKYVDATHLRLEAMPYDDDEATDTISPANKVRFSGNAWYTNPSATGLDSKNKYAAATITKEPGTYPVGSWKLVRDAEAQAMGYAGILNRGCCTWPIIKPDMNVQMYKNYDTITLEFENMYRTADDLWRKTKQTLQIFDTTANTAGTTLDKLSSINTILSAFVKGDNSVIELGTSDAEVE